MQDNQDNQENQNNQEPKEEDQEESISPEEMELYEVKAKLRSINGKVRSVHFKSVDNYVKICKRVAEQHPTLLKEEVQLAVELFLTEMVRTIIVDGKGVEITRFGVFKPVGKAARRRYQPDRGDFVWDKAGAKLMFSACRALKDYFKKYGKSIYGRLAAREKEAKEAKQKQIDLKNERARLLGYYRPAYVLPLDKLSEQGLRKVIKQGKLEERIKAEEEAGYRQKQEEGKENEEKEQNEQKEVDKGAEKN